MDKISWLIGIVGLNEYVYNLTGKQLHESKYAYIKGMELITFMNEYCKELSTKHGLNLKIEETPAESTAGRFAKLDKKKYGDKAFVQANDYGFYYSNRVHFAVNAKIDYVDELNYQSKFHPLVEAGSMIHIWVGDKALSPKAISNLIYKIWKYTKCSEMTISPNKTVCDNCKTTINGFFETCPNCNSDKIFWIARITGYQVRVDKFNQSKLAELFDRRSDDIENQDNENEEVFLLNDVPPDDQITVYTLPLCPNCKQIKKFCNENNISFSEINVNNDFKAKARLIVEGLTEMPIIQINRVFYQGDKEKLKNILLENRND
jgi:ribonucleoside-triphosphate reductase